MFNMISEFDVPIVVKNNVVVMWKHCQISFFATLSFCLHWPRRKNTEHVYHFWHNYIDITPRRSGFTLVRANG